MLADCCTDTSISHSVTLVPRLEYSGRLLGDVLESVRLYRERLAESNAHMRGQDDPDSLDRAALRHEQAAAFSLEALLEIQKTVGTVARIDTVPRVLPAVIPAVRATSARLHDVLPGCSRRLCELSVHLGSIALDSAALTQARFDFSESNAASAAMLDKVKLIADSKLRKQYPNVDIAGLSAR